MMQRFNHPQGVNRRFCEVWHICTTWYPISAVLSMLGIVVWKWKEACSERLQRSTTQSGGMWHLLRLLGWLRW
jgi:hypothetical protein